jgi:hypothetical protein
MTPEERELRRALDARSGEISSAFRSQVSATLQTGRPISNTLNRAVALLAVAALTISTIGVLVLARRAMGPVRSTPAPGSLAPATTLPCLFPIDKGKGGGAFVDIGLTPPPPLTGVTVTDDPASRVTLPNGEPRSGLSYDWQLKRWLPIPYKWISPDGSRYAYTDSQSRVHLVGVKDGSDRVLASGATWGLYAFGADGIYAGQRDLTKQPSLIGLWRIPTVRGSPQKLTADGSWLVIGPDAAWSVVQEGPLVAPEVTAGTVLQRLDLQTRKTTTWYTSAKGRFRVAAVDSNKRPVLVGVGVDSPLIWIVTAPGAAQTVVIGFLWDLMADSHGIWYLDPYSGLFYLVDGAGAHQLGQYRRGGNVSYPRFAGPCHPASELPAPWPPSPCGAEGATGWLTYLSALWGYSVDYPASWCNLPNFGAPEKDKYFASEFSGSPLAMTSSGMWLTLKADWGACPVAPSFKEIYDRTVLKVSRQDVTRTYGYFSPGGTEPTVMVYAAIAHESSCYTFSFLTQTRIGGDKYLSAADRMIASLRFSS